jgi:hypothetical protein
MPTGTDSNAERRVPLSRERVLRAAVALADENGIESPTRRKLGEAVGVERDVALQPGIPVRFVISVPFKGRSGVLEGPVRSRSGLDVRRSTHVRRKLVKLMWITHVASPGAS